MLGWCATKLCYLHLAENRKNSPLTSVFVQEGGQASITPNALFWCTLRILVRVPDFLVSFLPIATHSKSQRLTMISEGPGGRDSRCFFTICVENCTVHSRDLGVRDYRVLDWMIGYFALIHTIRNYRQYSAIADLHTSQFTATHTHTLTLGFSVFTTRILATVFNTVIKPVSL
jgi:hypothetical protein